MAIQLGIRRHRSERALLAMTLTLALSHWEREVMSNEQVEFIAT